MATVGFKGLNSSIVSYIIVSYMTHRSLYASHRYNNLGVKLATA